MRPRTRPPLLIYLLPLSEVVAIQGDLKKEEVEAEAQAKVKEGQGEGRGRS